MDLAQHSMIVNFIWGIADDCLRNVYVRRKYRNVILPMTVIRRIDAVLEPTKKAVLRMKEQLDSAKVTNQHATLCQAAGQAFYNASLFVLRGLKLRAKQQQLKVDFDACFPNSIIDFVPKAGIVLEFIYFLFSSMKLEFLRDAAVNTQKNLNIEHIGVKKVPIPFEEMQYIVIEYVKSSTDSMNLAISRMEREISLIQEYRTRLISDAVTGKIDLRDIVVPDIKKDDQSFDHIETDNPELDSEELEPVTTEAE